MGGSIANRKAGLLHKVGYGHVMKNEMRLRFRTSKAMAYTEKTTLTFYARDTLTKAPCPRI